MPTPVKYDTGGRGEGDNYHGLGWQARYVGDVTVPAGQYPKGFKPSAELQRVLDGDQPTEGAEPMVRRARLWPTPVKNEQHAAAYTLETSRRHFISGDHQVHLAQAVRGPVMYPTPTAGDQSRKPPEALRRSSSGMIRSNTGTFSQMTLGSVAKATDGRKIYPTPIKADSSIGKNLLTLQKVENGDGAFNMLAREVRKEEMVQAGTYVSDPGAVAGVTEKKQRRQWSTPTVTQPKMPTSTLVERANDPTHRGSTSVPLVEVLQREEYERVNGPIAQFSQAEKGLWPTPMTTGLRGGSGAPKDLNERIGGNAQNGGGRPRATIETPMTKGLRGGSGSEHWPGKYQSPGHLEYGELNPEWVEWIMGWCIGWTSLEPINPAAFEAWWQLQQADPETGLIDWWRSDPSDDPASGITKTVKPASKKEDLVRVSRIAALGNGQVSAACAGAHVFLSNMANPPAAEEKRDED